MRVLLFLGVLVTSLKAPEAPDPMTFPEAILRGTYHGEGGDIRKTSDYEDDSHNLTDYTNRHVEDGSSDEDDGADNDEEDVADDVLALVGGKVGRKDMKDIAPVASVISSAFRSRKTFSCPRIKTDLKTGTSIGDLSPEDISIIAAMGDAVATGIGLWPQADIEFRGAAFPIGGDATIDGLVTIPNILREFSPRLLGVSHGMGTSEQLPEHQLNVAVTGATSLDLPEQARELVRRLRKVRDVDIRQEWVMILITIGTEEICMHCRPPNLKALVEAIDILQMSVPKAFVVLLGPLHVSFSTDQMPNLLKHRCECSRTAPDGSMGRLTGEWKATFQALQDHVDDSDMARPTFGVLALPLLTITSRFPKGLFIPNRPLLNRRGHNYATKWLWNRLIAGDKYNLSSAVLSQDTYFCPSTGCPYFRTLANARGCQLLSLSEAKEKELALGNGKVIKKPRRSRERLYTIAAIIVGIAMFIVCTLGTVFYQKSKAASHGRFEIVEEPPKKSEETKKEEQWLLSRHNTRAVSELNSFPLTVSRHNTFRGTIDNDVPVKV